MIYNLYDLPIFHGYHNLYCRSSTLSWMIILNHLYEIIINKNHLKSLCIIHLHQHIHQQTSSIIWMLSGWWFQPLWKIWKSQLGWWHSQLNGTIKFMFQTTNRSIVTTNIIFNHMEDIVTINHLQSYGC